MDTSARAKALMIPGIALASVLHSRDYVEAELRSTETLAGALSDLERNVDQPVVPGDEREWASRVAESLDTVLVRWTQRHHEHEAVFQDILDQDLEMAARVKLLRHADLVLHQQLPHMRAHLELIPSRVDPAEPGDERHLEAMRESLLEWVACCRQFEQELCIWFTEAYYRDRGTVD